MVVLEEQVISGACLFFDSQYAEADRVSFVSELFVGHDMD